jgi:hypothetical protein
MRVRDAAVLLGSVEDEHEATRDLTVKAEFGRNVVSLHVSVSPGSADGTSVIEIHGTGQDFGGHASRKAIDRLCATL